MTADVHPLLRADLGAAVRIVRVEEPGDLSMAPEGMVAGAEVIVEKRIALGGPLIVRLGGTRLAVARSAARQVLVAPVAPADPGALPADEHDGTARNGADHPARGGAR